MNFVLAQEWDVVDCIGGRAKAIHFLPRGWITQVLIAVGRPKDSLNGNNTVGMHANAKLVSYTGRYACSSIRGRQVAVEVENFIPDRV
jgi:hypothetical protein